MRGESVRKNNFIKYYSYARAKALTAETIKAAFRKTGIHPLDPNAIPDWVYEAALNTTTQPSQPIRTALPDLLEISVPQSPFSQLAPSTNQADSPSAKSSVSDSPSNASSFHSLDITLDETTDEYFSRMTAKDMFRFSGLSENISADATLEDLHVQNIQLWDLLEKACHQMQHDFALKLQEQLFRKQKKPPKRFAAATASRHMTSEEALEALAYEEWKPKWIEVNKSFKERLRTIAKDKKADEEKQRQANKEERKRQKEIRDKQKELEQQEKEQRKVEKEIEKARKEAEKEATRLEKAAQKAERDRIATEKKAAIEEKKRVAAAEKERREKEKQKKGTGKKNEGWPQKDKPLEEQSDSKKTLTPRRILV
ncbi:hypothetical protein K435DRAFT_848538 [Dendrothele bispora CBS 962.96]|uniref:Uncharacterized protein n=1 Tax=Dendrothele bispora (strain CBS 962.96) TaxID=1314807 RepID=A0A4S8MV82_DENBC|nr:hypothetical protein K435DRAFT_848538 [Dendrothele bispora CBS 962.96]